MLVRLLLFNALYILVFNVLTDWYIYRTLLRPKKNRRYVRFHWALDVFFVAGLFLLFFLTLNGWISALVTQTFMWFYLAVYFPKFLYMLLSLPGQLFRPGAHGRAIVRGFAFGVALLIFLTMVYGNLVGIHRIRTEEVEIVSDKIPAAFDGYRIGLVADFHVGNMYGTCLIRRTWDHLAAGSPDVIVFAGDLVHSRTREVYPYREALAAFHAPDGIYTVMGNHDYGDYARWPNPEAYARNLTDLKEFYLEIDWKLLDNSSVYLRRGTDSIALLGVENWGEPPFQQYGDLRKAMEGVDRDAYKILITHNPNHWIAEVQGKTDIDLSMSGHTHAMQLAVKLPGRRVSPSSLVYPKWGGLYTEGRQHLYVNEGLGTTLLPFRIGSTPEITFITLRNSSK